MIKYQFDNTDCFPRVFCDVCGRPIDGPEGSVHWGDSGELSFAHLGACDRALRHKPETKNSENLVRFFKHLLRNTRITKKELENPDLRDDVFGAVASRKKLNRAAQGEE